MQYGESRNDLTRTAGDSPIHGNPIGI